MRLCYNTVRVHNVEDIMAHIKSRKTSKGVKRLYIRYFVNGQERTKSTKLEDTPKNRAFLKSEVLPILKERIANGYYERDKLTVLHYAKVYLTGKEHLKTYFEIQSRVDKILKTFGDREVADIKVYELREWIGSIKLSPKTLRSYVTDFRGIFELAFQDELIDVNPFDKIRLPKHEKGEIQRFSDEDMLKVLQKAPLELKNYFGIAFFTGMRSGEIIALTISDINFEKRYINVTKSISKGVIGTPKTKASIRKVPILDDCYPYLKSQVELAIKKGSLYLFSKKDKRPYRDISSLNAKRFLRHIGVQNRVYDTRHTFISKMLNSGKVKLLELAQMVGHTNPQMILTVYSKYIQSEAVSIDLNIELSPDRGYISGYSENLKAYKF